MAPPLRTRVAAPLYAADAPATDMGKLVLRLALGVLILLHGLYKVQHGVGGVERMLAAAGLPQALVYGVYLGEVLGPLMLILGVFTRLGALMVAVNMLFAFWLAHMGQLAERTAQGGWALELQGMYLASAIALMLTGGGRYGVGGVNGRWN